MDMAVVHLIKNNTRTSYSKPELSVQSAISSEVLYKMKSLEINVYKLYLHSINLN